MGITTMFEFVLRVESFCCCSGALMSVMNEASGMIHEDGSLSQLGTGVFFAKGAGETPTGRGLMQIHRHSLPWNVNVARQVSSSRLGLSGVGRWLLLFLFGMLTGFTERQVTVGAFVIGRGDDLFAWFPVAGLSQETLHMPKVDVCQLGVPEKQLPLIGGEVPIVSVSDSLS